MPAFAPRGVCIEFLLLRAPEPRRAAALQTAVRYLKPLHDAVDLGSISDPVAVRLRVVFGRGGGES